MSSENDENKELYEFDSSYLKELNQIRQQFNLIAISDDEDHCRSVSNHAQDSREEEEHSSRFSTASKSPETARDVRSIFGKSRTKKKERRHKKWKGKSEAIEMEIIYTPPKKKLCLRDSLESLGDRDSDEEFEERQWDYESTEHHRNSCDSTRSEEPSQISLGLRKLPHVETKDAVFDLKLDESEPSEQSSPVREPPLETYTVLNAEVTTPKLQDDPFLSLNVPLTYRNKSLKVHPKVTVLYEEQKPHSSEMSNEAEESYSGDVNERYDKKMLMTGLDLPKKSKEFYNFPSFVHIAKWGTSGDEEVKDNIFTGKDKFDLFPDLMSKKVKPGRKLTEVETISSLNDMYHFKTADPTVETVAESSTESLAGHTPRRDCIRDFCQCFSLCFVKKRRNFFS